MTRGIKRLIYYIIIYNIYLISNNIIIYNDILIYVLIYYIITVLLIIVIYSILLYNGKIDFKSSFHFFYYINRHIFLDIEYIEYLWNFIFLK